MRINRTIAALLSLLLLCAAALPAAAEGSISSSGSISSPSGGSISSSSGGESAAPVYAEPVHDEPVYAAPVYEAANTETAAAPAESAESADAGEPVNAELEIHIGSVEALRRLAGRCALDSYSTALTVVLDADLDLSGQEAVAIPIFNGTFEGRGHTISGLALTGGSNLGLFRYLQRDGVIRDLNVSGSVLPDEDSDKVGGIVGSSYGTLENCSFTGTVSGRNYVGGIAGESYGSLYDCRADAQVSGKRFTGGVVGYSEGLILGCENRGPINTYVTEEMLSLDDLAVVSSNTLMLLNAEDESVVSDSGGIAGYSSGVVMDCSNSGTIGYQHFGYNVGGIVGRQSGYLSGCENRGAVLGRKDVAGIVGQMEPYLDLINEVSLADEIVTLNQYLNAASGDLAQMSAEMSSLREDADAEGSSFLEDRDNADDGGGSISLAGGTASGSGGGSIGGGSGGTISGANGTVSSNATAREEYNSISDRIGEAYGIFSDTSGALSGDLTSANNQFSKVLTMLSDAVNGSANHSIFEDISEELGQEDTEGRVSGNRNYGRVEGDNNVGGVIGAMGIEYEFDMEDKVVETLGVNGIVNKTYETRCVSAANVNYGSVTGRKDRIGGVVGSSETGLVTDCEGYGSVESTDGGYVGGVAGYSGTSIRSSYAMCSLHGGKYVGGITGYGSAITDCATLIDLSGGKVCTGAIAGWADMAEDETAVDRNVYVHDYLGAVDGISYADRAAPVSYEELVAREGVPEAFRAITVSFLAEGETVAEIRLPYGGTLAEEQIPAVPVRPGYVGAWPSFERENLRFNSTVEAVYELTQHTLAVEATRGDSPMSVLLVEGEFSEEIHVSLTPYEGEGPAEQSLLEAWTLKLEGYSNPDGEGYTVRFLTPETERGAEPELWRQEEGGWVRLETGRSGSYVTFHADEAEQVFAVTVRDDLHERLLPWYIAGGAALLAVIVIAAAAARGKKKKSAEAEKPVEAEKPTETAEKPAETAEKPAEAAEKPAEAAEEKPAETVTAK